MLDDDDGVTTVHQFLEHIHQNTDILEVETRRRLVEDVKGLAGIPLRQFGGELHALALSAGEGGGRLPELDVSQSDILYGLDLTEDIRYVLEELHGLVDGHVEHVGDRLALVAHLERLTIIAFAMTFLAGHLDIRKEVHLDGLVTVTATGLAAPTFHVERETTRLIASYLGFGQVDEEAPDI